MIKRFGLVAAIVISSQCLSGSVAAQGTVARSSADALRYFDAICGSTLPDFRNAPAALRANKFKQAPTGTWFLPDGSVSIKIKDGPGFGKTCSFVANSSDGANGIKASVARMFPNMASSGVPNSTLYKKTTAMVTVERITQLGRVSVFQIDMMSAR